MALSDYVLIPGADYQDACNAVREKTGSTDKIVSGDLGDRIRGIAGGGSSGEEGTTIFEDNLGLSKYFLYQLDISNKQVILHHILYLKLYEDTGSYDITVPDTLFGWDVVISSEGV